MSDMNRRERIDEANRLIHAISEHGRRFFHNKKFGRVARFEQTLDGRLWFRDDYTDKRSLTSYKWRWKHFSHGGTLRALVDALAAYIRTGEPINSRYLGPWPEHYGEGDLWGYGKEAMAELREQAGTLRCIRRSQP